MISSISLDKDLLTPYIQGKNYILYMMSALKMGKQADAALYWENEAEILEARFFDEKGELHIFDFEGEKRAVYICDEEEDEANIMKEYQYLRDPEHKELEVKKYIAYDEFGQAYVKAMRPNRFV